MDLADMLLVVCVVVFTALAAFSDARTYRLPNKLTVPAFFAGVIFNSIRGYLDDSIIGNWRDGGFLYAMGGFLVGFAIFWVLWIIGGGGAGDVKFMGALGAWLGAVLIFKVFVIGVILMIVGSLAMMAFAIIRVGFKGMKKQYFARTKNRSPKQTQAPKRKVTGWGVPVAVATWLVLVLDVVHLPIAG